jgi:tetratricopeptide (TPR) repeat protein
LLGVIVIGSVLALGAVHPGSILVISVLTSITWALCVRTSAGRAWREWWKGPVGIGVALAGFTLLQALPLPASLVGWVAPRNADVWARSLLPFGEDGPRWISLSLDPGATLLEALKWLTYAGVFACACTIARRRGRTWGIILVFASGVVVALVTMAHGLVGATKVYGWYEPHFMPALWHVGPLLNSNNLSGYLNLAAMCGAGLLLSRQSRAPRWLVGLGVTILGAVVVISASRGGVIGLILGLSSLGLLLGLTEQGGSSAALPKRKAGLLLGLAITGVGLFAALGGRRETWAELYDKSLLKVRMLAWARPMIAQYWATGVGRGAFESVFPAYRTYSEHIVFTHAENFPVQWMTEWGIPVAFIALVGFAWFLRPAALGLRRSILAMGVAVGAAVLLIQNLVDLGLEVCSVMVALAMALGSIWGGWEPSSRPRRSAAEGESRRGRQAGWPLVLAALGLVVLAVGPMDSLHDVARDRYDLHERFRSWMSDRATPGKVALEHEIRRAMARHPAEPYFPLLAAEVKWRGGARDNPVPALARSLERSSQNGRAHLLLAEILASAGARSQARLELRLAVTDEPALAESAARLALRMPSSLDELLDAVPVGSNGIALLESLSTLATNPSLRLALLGELLSRAPSNLPANVHLAEFYLGELALGERSRACAGSSRAACEEKIRGSIARVAAARPTFSQADQYRARLLMLDGKAEEAEAMLASRCPSVDDIANCQFMRAQVAASISGKAELLHNAVRDLQQVACGSAAECAATAVAIGDMLAARGEWGTALTSFKRACKEQPSEVTWFRLAEAASKVGAHAQAADALENAARLREGGMDDALRARIQTERNLAYGIVRE